MGPYPFQTDIIITVSNDQDVNCGINSDAIKLYACPPENAIPEPPSIKPEALTCEYEEAPPTSTGKIGLG